MALVTDLQMTAITLPLDTVLEVMRGAARGEPISADTMDLMRLEICSVLCAMDRLEEEVVDGIMKQTFGD